MKQMRLLVDPLRGHVVVVRHDIAPNLAKTPSPVATASAHLNDGSEARDLTNAE
jgi:hypothetical protein